ncbi:MAG: ATP synthase A1 subunit C [Methanothrix sp.]|nr:ATP synthase A1 subunit C [Methanothrix sp.]
MTVEELVTSVGFPSIPLAFMVMLAGALVIGIGAILVWGIMHVIDLSGYAYIHARVMSMESRLIREEKLKEMMGASTLAGVHAALETTDYSPYLQEMMEARAEAIERALNKHMAETYHDISKMVFNSLGVSDLKKLLDIILQKWDVYNLKRILRGIYAERSIDEIRADLVPVGKLEQDRKTLDLLVGAKSMEEAISGLVGTPYAALATSLPAFDQTKNLTVLEAKLDKILYENLWKVWKEVMPKKSGSDNAGDMFYLNAYLAALIDVLNLKFLFRGKGDKVPSGTLESYLVAGGDLPASLVKGLIEMETVGSMVSALEGTKYYQPVVGAAQEYDATGSILPIETALDKYLAKVTNDLSRMKPFGMGPVIRYLSKKEIEIRNIRAIARGKEVGLSLDDITKLIVKVGT